MFLFQPHPRLHGNTFYHPVQPSIFPFHTGRDSMKYSRCIIFKNLGSVVQMIYKILGSSSRCLDTSMRNTVQHRIVTLMPYTGYNRYRKLSTISRQLICIEPRKVGRGASATDNNHDIPIITTGMDSIQCGNDRLFYPFPLHNSRKQTRIKDKTIGILFQLITKITITGSRSRGNNGYALRQQRNLQFLIQSQHTFFFQLLQDFATATRHIPQCISRIYILHSKRVTIQFMKLHSHFHHHFNTCNKSLPGFLFKIRLQQTVDIAPNSPPCLSYQIIPPWLFLYKFQIAMTGIIGTYITQLCLNPISIGQTSMNATLNQRIQFI